MMKAAAWPTWFNPAIVAIDRVPCFRETGLGVREAQLDRQIACLNHACEFAHIPKGGDDAGSSNV